MAEADYKTPNGNEMAATAIKTYNKIKNANPYMLAALPVLNYLTLDLPGSTNPTAPSLTPEQGILVWGISSAIFFFLFYWFGIRKLNKAVEEDGKSSIEFLG